ncbi:SpoIID/LytB domain-containing protein [Paenibacillus yanchengensis]|uniref:SpoIID/LytB domain-containing protein n=1 Tax=Paenibacillus yanchengensis TaxID=2035833 RepID=A0ABW4YLB5_9BACL
MTKNKRQTRQQRLFRSIKRMMISTVALATIVSMTPALSHSERVIGHASANETVQTTKNFTDQQIRVALFLNLPGKYTNITNTATFSSTGGMQIGMKRDGGAIQPLFTIDSQQTVHIGLNDYKVKVLETTNIETARAALKHLQAAKGTGLIRKKIASSAMTYEVVEGSYETLAAANGALKRWQTDSKLLGITKQFKTSVLGPYNMQSTSYATEQAATQAAELLTVTGLPVAIGMNQDKVTGNVVYTVLVGAQSTEAALKTVEQTLKTLANEIVFSKVESSEPYIIVYDDYTNGASKGAKALQIAGSTNKVLVTPKSSEQPIKLVERSAREYRGQFELSKFNEKLAVINELSLEQYLYSVVAVEMYPSWPMEALKAQAVAARTFALQKGLNFQVAHVVDTTLSQVYNGIAVEQDTTTRAVNETAGYVLKHNGKLIEALYSSNAGGASADSVEAWGSSIPYLKSANSPDEIAARNKVRWFKVATKDNKVGFVSEKDVADNGKQTMAGSRMVDVSGNNISLRTNPTPTDTMPIVASLSKGAVLTVLEEVVETNPMHWRREANEPAELLTALNGRANPKVKGPIEKLEVTKRGPSGRVIEVSVNGTKVNITSPDQFRSALGVKGSLPSTRFDIQNDSEYVVLGADGKTTVKNSKTAAAYAVDASGKKQVVVAPNLYQLAGDGNIRAVSKKHTYSIVGTGYGHGVGMSQYGAYALAEQGQDFKYILQHYYKDVAIVKD